MQGLYFCLSCLFFIVFLSILNVDAVEVRGRLKLSNKWTKYRQQEQGSTVSLKIPVTYKENEEDQAKKKELGRQEREVRQAEKEEAWRGLPILTINTRSGESESTPRDVQIQTIQDIKFDFFT